MSALMNRAARRAYASGLRTESQSFGRSLREIPRAEWPSAGPPGILRVWRSCDFLVQQYGAVDGVTRLSVCRTVKETSGRWEDGISWEQLQRLKSEAGFGAVEAVEVFPPDDAVVNVANMRHLWLLPERLPFSWGKP